MDIQGWAEALTCATAGWNRAFGNLQLSPLTPAHREKYQDLISKLGVTRG